MASYVALAAKPMTLMACIDPKSKVPDRWIKEAVKYAERNNIPFWPESAHITIHYMGQNVDRNTRAQVISIYAKKSFNFCKQDTWMVKNDQCKSGVVSLFGKSDNKLAVNLMFAPYLLAVCTGLRNKVVKSCPSVRPPDFESFNPHLTLGTFGPAVTEEQKKAFIDHMKQFIDSCDKFEETVSQIVIYSKQEGRDYKPSAKISFE